MCVEGEGIKQIFKIDEGGKKALDLDVLNEFLLSKEKIKKKNQLHWEGKWIRTDKKKLKSITNSD